MRLNIKLRVFWLDVESKLYSLKRKIKDKWRHFKLRHKLKRFYKRKLAQCIKDGMSSITLFDRKELISLGSASNIALEIFKEMDKKYDTETEILYGSKLVWQEGENPTFMTLVVDKEKHERWNIGNGWWRYDGVRKVEN